MMNFMWLSFVCGFSVLSIGSSIDAIVPSAQSPLEVAKQWNLLTYNFDYNSPVDDKDFYNPQNVLLTGLAVGYDRIFVASPRLFSGVPATISSVSRSEFGDSPPLQAYPDWSFHTAATRSYNCSDLGLVSVYRLKIDSCNRLWALDAGVSRSLEDFEVTCPPKILIFDLNTNQVVRRIDFPREVLRGESLFTNLIIDETTAKPGGNCDDVFAYISDTVEPAIVVYDSSRDLTWRMTHPAMYPDPDFAQSEIQEHRFVLMDGIVGLSFDERIDMLYFQPLATDRIFSIEKRVLRAGPIPINQVLPVRLVGKKSSQGIGMVVSPLDGSIIFSPLTETAVASYNPNTNEQTILAYDPEALQFVADMTTSPSDPGAIYVVSSKFHRFFLKNLNPNELNNRVLRISLPGARHSPALPIPNHIPYKSLYIGQPHESYPYPPSNALEKKAKFEFVGDDYFSGPRQPQPFQFQPVGLHNKGIANPFAALNHGETLPRTLPVIPLYQQNTLLRRAQPLQPGPPILSSYMHYNRITKSIPKNVTSHY